MVDHAPILQLLGLGDQANEAPDAEVPGEQDAALLDPTAAEASEPSEHQTLAEAEAALSGEDAPSEVSESEQETPESTPYTPEQIAAILAENDAFKAEKAQASAQSEEVQWETMWDDFEADGEEYYDNLRAIVREYGLREGMSQREIRGLIAEVVDDGNGIESINKLTPGVLTVPQGQPGYKAWMLTAATNRRVTTNEWRATRNQPTVIEQLTAQYKLDAAQQTALAKFVNYPKEAIEEIAKTLGAENLRKTTTQSEATKQAQQNLAKNLSNGISPGTPGASAPKKPYQYTHEPATRRQETRHFARSIGLIRDSA